MTYLQVFRFGGFIYIVKLSFRRIYMKVTGFEGIYAIFWNFYFYAKIFWVQDHAFLCLKSTYI